MDRGSQHGWQGAGTSHVVASTSAPPGLRHTGPPNGSVALNGHAPQIRAGVNPRQVLRNGRVPEGRVPDGGQGRGGATIRRVATGTPRRTILLIALLTAVLAASVALAAGWLAGVLAAFVGSIVAFLVTSAATRREATQHAAQEAAIAAVQRAAVGVAVAALGERDGATADHSDEVVELAASLADRMRVDEEERRRLLVAAQLHDLGKVAVPTEILHKPGPLDDDEWDVMRTHTLVGERILRSVPELADVATIVRHSHEHYDGSGYPDGLAGHEIPLSSRIILCADAYHAIRSNRPYRAGRSADEALTEIRTHAGRQFDPQVAEALEHAASDARRGQVLRGASLTGSRRLAALLLVLSIGSSAALAADGPARSVIEDVYAAGPITTSPNRTGPGQPCLLLDPSSAVCAPGLPVLSGAAPGLERARFTGAPGRAQARTGSGSGSGHGGSGGGPAATAAAGLGSARVVPVSGAIWLPVVGVVLPGWATRPPVGAIGSPAAGRGGSGGTGGSPVLPVLPVAPPAGAADPRPIIWPGTPAAAEVQNAGGLVETPGASGTSGTQGADGAAGTPGGGTPGGGTAPAPGAVPGTGVGDDRGKRRGRKGRRGRGRGGERRRGGDHSEGASRGEDDQDSRGRGGRGGGERGKGEGNRGGGAPSGGGGGDAEAGDDKGKGGAGKCNGGKGGGGNGNGNGGNDGGGQGSAGQGGAGQGGGGSGGSGSGGGGSGTGTGGGSSGNAGACNGNGGNGGGSSGGGGKGKGNSGQGGGSGGNGNGGSGGDGNGRNGGKGKG